jgi:hypothetical protein
MFDAVASVGLSKGGQSHSTPSVEETWQFLIALIQDIKNLSK